ncbi:hypothetical protein ACC699_40340, partial [Rhizobium ruizarguesonis]
MLAHGFVDEFHLLVGNVVLGGGVKRLPHWQRIKPAIRAGEVVVEGTQNADDELGHRKSPSA